jgi:hypothetical protein
MANIKRLGAPSRDTGFVARTITLPFDAVPGDYLRRVSANAYERCSEEEADAMLMQFAKAGDPVTVVVDENALGIV